MIKKRKPWILLIVLLYCAVTVMSVSAHALLLRSNPAANAVLEQPPIQVELFFTEALEPKLSSVTVIDSNGTVVDVGDSRVDPSDPTRMTVSLRSITDGVYTVSWKALSTIDGHQTVGSFPFAVGSANAEAVQAIKQSTTVRLPAVALIAKFLLLASLALLAGRPLFILLVWNPALRGNPIKRPALWNTLYRIGLIGALLSIGFGVLSQVGQSVGKELVLPWDPQVGSVLLGTRLGMIWLVRLILVIASTWLAGIENSAMKVWGGLMIGLGLMLTVTFTSHAATEARPLIPILGDWLHLTGMAFWFGGVAHLAMALRQLRFEDGTTHTKATSLLASKFSVNALFFVALIGVTGFYSAYLRLGSWSALVGSLYGQALLFKQLFVGGLLVIAAINLLIISPRLKRGRIQQVADTGVVVRFAKNVTMEVVLAALLLGSVSFLSYIPPAKAASQNTDLTDRARVDDLRVNINVSPGQVGPNTFTLNLYENGKPLRSAKEVLLRFTSTEANLPPSELQLIGDGNGMFSAKGANLSLPGRWQVQAVVRRVDKFDAYANFNFSPLKPGTTESSSSTFHEAGILLIVLGAFCGLVVLSDRILRPPVRWGLGMPVTALVIVFGIISLAQPVVATESGQANPIPPNQESVATGKSLYKVNCLPCHGSTGKGDGPVGVTLNPQPADLTKHTVPGVHTDAQLFEWISNGFPGSQMPAFKTGLSDTDRWNIVNFIRTLAR